MAAEAGGSNDGPEQPHILEGATISIRVTGHDGRVLSGSAPLTPAGGALLEVTVPGLVGLLAESDPMRNGALEEEEEDFPGDGSDLSAYMAEMEARAERPCRPNFGVEKMEVVASLSDGKEIRFPRMRPIITNNAGGDFMFPWWDRIDGKHDIDGYYATVQDCDNNNEREACRMCITTQDEVVLVFYRGRCRGDYKVGADRTDGLELSLIHI